MAEYTYADVIINPNDPRIEVGKKYYYNSNPFDVLDDANNGVFTGILKDVIEDSNKPFQTESGNCWSCIIRKKEPEKKYVPFDLNREEVREKLRGRWVKSNRDSGFFEFQITQFSMTNILNTDIVVINTAKFTVDSEELLRDYVFIDDGTPCGELVDTTSDGSLPGGENDN